MQSLIDNASPGDTITLTQDYTENTTISVNKGLTIVGRANSSAGVRPKITITTSSSLNIAGINVSVPNVTFKGLEIIISNTNANIDQGAINYQAGLAADFVNQSAVPINENLIIDDCRIVYPKNAVYISGNNISVTNCELHSTVTTTTTIRSLFFYHNNGSSVISNNVFTTAGGAALSGIFAQHNGSNGFRNTHSGSIEFYNNTCAVAVTGRFIHLQGGVGTNNPAGADPLSMEVYNNTIAGNTTSFFLYETTSNTSLEAIGQVLIHDNTLFDAYRDGVVRIAKISGGDIDTFTNNPKFTIFNNTTQTIMNTSTGLVLENVLSLTGYTNLPGNIGDILSVVPIGGGGGNGGPGPQSFPEQVIAIVQGNSDSFDIGTVIGLGSEQGITIPLVKKAVSGEVSTSYNPDVELNATLTMKTPTALPENVERALGLFKTNYRSTINAMNVVVQFAVKFVNTLTEEFDSTIGSTYRLSIPTHPNRRYLSVYKELSNGSTSFVANANIVSGQSDVYEFSIPGNSVYSIVDPELFLLPGVSAPYWLNGRLALGSRVLTDANGDLLSSLTIDNESALFATGDIEVGGDVMIGDELAVTGQSVFSSNVSVNAPLTVTDNLIVDTDTFIVDAANNNVGIGKTNPAVKLDVVGAITSTTTVTASNLVGTLNTAAQPNITSVGTLSSLNVSGNLAVDTNVLFVNADTNRVGINSSSPSQALDVTGNVVASGSITAVDVYGTVQTASQPNITTVGTLTALSVSGGSQLTGNVGIGTSARSDTNLWIYDPFRPDAQTTKRFLFGGYSNSNPYGIMLENGTGFGYSPTLRGKAYDDDDEGLVMIGQLTSAGDNVGRTCFRLDGRRGDVGYGGPVGTARLFEISNYAVPQLVVTAAGNVGIGITNPSNKLSVSGNANITGTMDITGNTTMSGSMNVRSGVLFVSSSNNRVGINTITPSKELDVVGDGQVSGTFTATNLVGTLLTAAQPNVTSVGTLISLDVTGDATFDAGTLKVDSVNNRVGINTTAPAYALDVIGSGAISGDLNVEGTLEVDNIVSGGEVLNIGCTSSTTTVNLACGSGVQAVNIGANDSTGVTTINIGGPGDMVNIAGTVTTINATNTDIKDKNITLNKGGATASAFGAGIEVEENSAITGFIKLNTNRDAWIISAPADTYSDAAQIVTTEGPLFVKSASDLYYTAGNVGIGLTNPSVALDVVGAGKFSSDLTIGSTSVFKVNVATGNVGVGYTGNASYTLSVDGHAHLTSGNSYYIASSQVLSETTLGSSVVNSSLTSVGTLSSLNVSGNLAVDTNVLFVDATNNRVGINTSTPGYDLEVVGNGYVSGNMTVNTDITVNGNIYNNSMSAGNGVPLALDSNGKVVKATSSRRYKDNIQPLEERTSPKEVIASLQPVVFEYKNVPGQKVYGLIAEDVEQVNQDLVIYKDDQVDGVHYMQIIPLLIAEIKNLRQEVADLRNLVVNGPQ
jgi:hypothetical protein